MRLLPNLVDANISCPTSRRPAACQRKVYSPHADANQDDQVWGSQDIWSGKWCVSEMKICEQKKQSDCKTSVNLRFRRCTPSKKHPDKKHLTWVSRWFFGIQDVNSNPTQVRGEAGQGQHLSQWIDVIIFTIPQDLAQKIHAGKLITVAICIIDLSITTPKCLTKATWNMLCTKVSHRRVENTCHMRRGEKPAYLSSALLGPVCLPK